MSVKLLVVAGGIAAVMASAGTSMWPNPLVHSTPSAFASALDTEPALDAEPAPRETLFIAPGVTEPRSRTIRLFGEMPGRITALHVDAGDHVRAGDVLVELESDSQIVGVEYARAALDKAEARLERYRNGDRPEERAALRAQVDEAAAAVEMAKLELRWISDAVARDAASERESARANNDLALAKARHAMAQSRWELSRSGTRAEDLAAVEADVRVARAQLASAEILLDRTQIRSPIDGQVIYRFAEVGELVHADAPLPVITVGDCSQMHVRVDVDESDIGRIQVGQRTMVAAGAFPDRVYSGTVVHVEPTLGRKNFRTQLPTERLDTRIQEVVVRLDGAAALPVELQVAVRFLGEWTRIDTPAS